MCGSSPFQEFAGLGFKDMPGSSGICHQRSEISIAEITDGTASTYLVGEKNVAIADYSTGLDPGDDQCYLSGDDLDLQRWTAAPPLADQPDEHHDFAFGSARPSGFNTVYADASVHHLPFDINPIVHRLRGNRSDGEVIPE